MKKWAAAALAVALVGCSSEAETGTFDSRAFIAEVKTWDAVKDVAVSDDGKTIYVGVLDNGNNRDGYAMSVCEEVRANSSGDLDERTISILDAAASLNDEFKRLGKHRCEI